jgi:hypothetical protein
MALAAGLAAAPAAALAACSGGGSKSDVAPTTTQQTTTTTSAKVKAVNKRANAGDFIVEIRTADPHDNLLKMQASVTNTLSSPQEFNPIFTVTSAGKTYDGAAAKNPTISSGATVAVELDVAVDTTFTIADAVVIFGNTSKNQATIPLGSTGSYVSLLDVPATPPAPVTVGEQVFRFTRAVVSAFGYDGTNLDAGTEELILTFSVTNSDPQYSYAIAGSDFKFVNGGETLVSSVVKDVSVNSGGTVNGARVYADVDNYRPGTVITMTVIGSDSHQANVTQTVQVSLPPLV